MGKGTIIMTKESIIEMLKLPEGFHINELAMDAGNFHIIVESEKIPIVPEHECLPALIPQYEIAEDMKSYKCTNVEIKRAMILASNKDFVKDAKVIHELLRRQATIKQ
jgi:hypothetical protein